MSLREAMALALLYASCRDETVRVEARTLVPALDEAIAALDRMVERELAERELAEWDKSARKTL